MAFVCDKMIFLTFDYNMLWCFTVKFMFIWATMIKKYSAISFDLNNSIVQGYYRLFTDHITEAEKTGTEKNWLAYYLELISTAAYLELISTAYLKRTGLLCTNKLPKFKENRLAMYSLGRII